MGAKFSQGHPVLHAPGIWWVKEITSGWSKSHRLVRVKVSHPAVGQQPTERASHPPQGEHLTLGPPSLHKEA